MRPALAYQDALRARGWIADQLDQGQQFDMARTERREDGVTHADSEPIHEKMFWGCGRVMHQPDRERQSGRHFHSAAASISIAFARTEGGT